jgi:hypothetical protein
LTARLAAISLLLLLLPVRNYTLSDPHFPISGNNAGANYAIHTFLHLLDRAEVQVVK